MLNVCPELACRQVGVIERGELTYIKGGSINFYLPTSTFSLILS
jgi:hypothetical protein